MRLTRPVSNQFSSSILRGREYVQPCLKAQTRAASARFQAYRRAFILPPGTPRDRVEILKEEFRKTYRDLEFHKEHKNSPA
jgi:hypothetical protein